MGVRADVYRWVEQIIPFARSVARPVLSAGAGGAEWSDAYRTERMVSAALFPDESLVTTVANHGGDWWRRLGRQA